MKELEEENERTGIEAEREEVRLSHELAKIKAGNNGNNSLSPIHVSSAVRPNLPVYQESEDFASCLIRFERVASLLDISEDSYAVRLGSLLTDVFSETPVSITSPSVLPSV
ncbi:uncharacterized protein LOC119572392 [Penaeus monodon]|uniref:uncharacterized protein LOC119572392 n=1 Tax=Penaeus monodon TaxID=6687 RepID=UPI0018A72922|nr:uncharacterized protein LOC119572392 [Penaeus monodon]